MMKNCLILIVLFAVVFSQGCCSIFSSKSQLISIDSEPSGAEVKIGPIKGVTPFDVKLPRGKDYFISAKYNGQEQTQSLERSISGLYWVNILLWPGLIVDAATGKMYKYDPTDYSFDFTQAQ